jgi:kynureninase
MDFRKPEVVLLHNECHMFQIFRDHLTTEAKLHSISEIVASYVDSLRPEFQKPRLVVYLLMDSLGAHGNADVLSFTKQ